MSLAPKLAYIGHGTRMYGIRPILGRPRGFWELQWVAKGSARPDNLPLDQTTGHGPRLYVSDPDSPHGWTDSGSGLSEVFVLQFRTVPPELARP